MTDTDDEWPDVLDYVRETPADRIAACIEACDCPPEESQRLQAEWLAKRDGEKPQLNLPLGEKHGAHQDN